MIVSSGKVKNFLEIVSNRVFVGNGPANPSSGKSESPTIANRSANRSQERHSPGECPRSTVLRISIPAMRNLCPSSIFAARRTGSRAGANIGARFLSRSAANRRHDRNEHGWQIKLMAEIFCSSPVLAFRRNLRRYQMRLPVSLPGPNEIGVHQDPAVIVLELASLRNPSSFSGFHLPWARSTSDLGEVQHGAIARKVAQSACHRALYEPIRAHARFLPQFAIESQTRLRFAGRCPRRVFQFNHNLLSSTESACASDRSRRF